MKKLIVLSIALVAALNLTSCDKKAETTETTEVVTDTVAAPVEETAVDTAAAPAVDTVKTTEVKTETSTEVKK
ncbi:hypothetical protein R1T16_07315 [Flavobacterium sp. DG1-102-2]|uniref:hypothetical protein n=1 Tax=Flavobacterium sp. DG1-102-2 TaxID=3081663 RepID=UPI00294A06B1|nr:hypothetical protein [Flavobacterium sp. DG1-102-2]MDV6168229.1 hypothetical protein [Flavobacterium sp. DG1-102-2]